MTRVPYPGDIKRALSRKTRARGMGYRFEITKPIIVTILLFVVAAAVFQTWSVSSSEETVQGLALLLVKHLAVTSAYAAVIVVLLYAVFAPYKLYDGVTRLFGKAKGKPR